MQLSKIDRYRVAQSWRVVSILSMSVQKGEGGQGNGPCGIFSGLESLFSNNDFQKKNHLHQDYSKNCEIYTFTHNLHIIFFLKRGGVSEKSTWLGRGQPKVHVRSTRGEGGQKVLKIGPNGL